MKRLNALILALIFSSSLLVPTLQAQQGEAPAGETGSEAPVPETETTDATDDTGSNDTDARPQIVEEDDLPIASNEDFNPSVQISEDLSVSFPVDI